VTVDGSSVTCDPLKGNRGGYPGVRYRHLDDEKRVEIRLMQSEPEDDHYTLVVSS